MERGRAETSDTAPALDQIDDQDDDSDDEQDVDESTHRVGANESEQPQHEKDNEDSPEHIFLWLS
jgi:hypothetical protein